MTVSKEKFEIRLPKLHKFDDKRVVDPLLGVISESEQDNVISNALNSLRKLAQNGVVGIELLDTLNEVLNSDVYPDQFKALAVTTMGEFSDHRVIEPLEQVLKDSDGTNSKVRKLAAKALANQEGALAVGPLIEALDDRDPDVRYHALDSLGEVGTPEAVEPIVELLLDESEDMELRISATDALEEIGDPSIATHIKDISGISKSSVRGAILFTFGELGIDEMLPKLEEIASNPDATGYERKMALVSIGKIGNTSSIEVLESTIDGANDDLRVRSVQALGGIPSQKSREILMEVLAGRDQYLPEMRRAAAIALRRHGSITAIDTLIEATTDPVYGVRKAAMEALSSLDEVRADHHLIDICNNQDDHHNVDRAVAAWQLRKAVNQREATQALLDLLEEEEDVNVTLQIIDALGVIGNKAAAEPIVEYASNESFDRDLRESAIQSLGLISDPVAKEPAEQIARNESNPMGLRRFALLTLGNLDTASAERTLNGIIQDEEVSQDLRLIARHIKQVDPDQIQQTLENARDRALEEAEATLQ